MPRTPIKSRSSSVIGSGGELHQTASTIETALRTSQGAPVSDDQNSLKAGVRGPTLIEDQHLRDKIMHFDHERMPERVVHARGSAAHGSFQPTAAAARYSKAAFLADPKKKTDVFVRFSTVAGGSSSPDLARDVRGFAVKFYTDEGNFDLVGNNIPVFFIQDAMKFPDLIHAAKQEPDRGFPQAATAHDTFWDFVSLMPESTHMLMWIMSDRTIPRSLRMMEGFGVHTFRMIDAKGTSRFVKFHWRPVLGTQSVLWDEAVKINGADADFHRRDLWDAIERGDFPEWEFAIQAFDEEEAQGFGFDVLDPTKLIPEEVVPLVTIGKMVLNRNPVNHFAEVEQVAFQAGNLVPGIDFSNDPLLQGRVFSYLDTQLNRFGTANFGELPINKPRCPMHNFQRDGFVRQEVNPGRVSYEPNSLDSGAPRESPKSGFSSVREEMKGPKVRERSPSFADHYTQARMFFRSMTDVEQAHMVSAFAFELGKVETVAIRTRVLGHLALTDEGLCEKVEEKLGMVGQRDQLKPAIQPTDMAPSPALSILGKAEPTLRGRKVGVLVTDGADATVLEALRSSVTKAGGVLAVVAPKAGGCTAKDGKKIDAQHALAGTPSILFDAVAVLASPAGAEMLAKESDAVAWVRDAYQHCKIIGCTTPCGSLLGKAALEPDEGILVVDTAKNASAFVEAAKGPRIYEREVKLHA